MRKVLLVFLVLTAILSLLFLIFNEPLPVGSAGPEADALAEKMMAATHNTDWKKTGAVRWVFAGVHEHLWDRRRHFARVRWDETEVLVDLDRKRGLARVHGQRVAGAEAERLIDRAWEYWVNDAFWLNPIAKTFDPGTARALIPLDADGAGLLVTFNAGGATPGDHYLWILDAGGRPVRWKMWVSILPLGGVGTTWESWVTLATGARVATVHKHPLFTLRLSGVAGAATLAELEPGDDPFQALEQEPAAARGR